MWAVLRGSGGRLLFFYRLPGLTRVTKVEILPPVDRFFKVTGLFHPVGSDR